MGTLRTIHEQVDRLAAIIGAPSNSLPTYGRSAQSGLPHVEVTSDGQMHFVVCERGVEFERWTTLNPDQLLYWVFQSVTFSMACDYELRHRIEGEDFRRQLFAHQLQLLHRLNPTWRVRRINELGSRLEDAGLDVHRFETCDS